MKIVRWGTDNDSHGEYEVNLKNADVNWSGQTLRVHANGVPDFAWQRMVQTTEQPGSKSNHHDYELKSPCLSLPINFAN